MKDPTSTPATDDNLVNPLPQSGDASLDELAAMLEQRKVVQRKINLNTEQVIDNLFTELANLVIEHDKLVDAVRAVYYAAHWSADRPCDAQKLWTDLRDAAGFAPGGSPKPVTPVVKSGFGAEPLEHTDDGEYDRSSWYCEKCKTRFGLGIDCFCTSEARS